MAQAAGWIGSELLPVDVARRSWGVAGQAHHSLPVVLHSKVAPRYNCATAPFMSTPVSGRNKVLWLKLWRRVSLPPKPLTRHDDPGDTSTVVHIHHLSLLRSCCSGQFPRLRAYQIVVNPDELVTHRTSSVLESPSPCLTYPWELLSRRRQLL